MYTSMLLVALAGYPVLANAEDASAWQTDYSQARKLGQTEKKPLAVFVATGKNGYNKIGRDGTLSKETEQLLTAKYVPVYIDSATPAGKRLASSLGLESGMGLVISDASGDLMAFYHEGDLFNVTLDRYLQRYSDPNRVVSTTDVNPGPGGHHASGGYGGGYCSVGGGGCYSGGCSTGGCYSGGCYSGGCYSGGCYSGGCYSGGCYSGGCGKGHGGRGGKCR